MDLFAHYFISMFFGLVAVLVLVLANAVFVAAEFALVRSQITRLKSAELTGKVGTKSAIYLIERMELTLSALQLGVTIASLLLGWLGESVIAAGLVDLSGWVGIKATSVVVHSVATTTALIVITFLHVVLGELCAKSLGIRYPETVLRVLAPPISLFAQSCRFIIYIFDQCANLVLRLFGMRSLAPLERIHTPVELSMLITQSTEHGVLDKDEEEMLKGIFGFSETVAREVMTPRLDLVTIPIESSFDEIVNFINLSGYSRFPVIGETIDDVRGVLLARDLLVVMPEYIKTSGRNFELKRYLREPYFIPGTKPIDDLLNEFKRRKLHMAIVLDEHGGIDGAVTLEDLLEEIVGDIYDESDRPVRDLVTKDGGDVLLDGGLLVEDVNEKFQLGVPTGDYDTVAGFVFHALGRAAEIGDAVHVKDGLVVAVNDTPSSHNGKEPEFGDDSGPFESQELQSSTPEIIFKVEQVSGNKIEMIRVHRVEQQELPPSEMGEAEETSNLDRKAS